MLRPCSLRSTRNVRTIRGLVRGMYVLYQQLQETLVMLATQSRNLALKIEDDIIIEFKEITRKLNVELGISIDAERHSRKAVLSRKSATEKVPMAATVDPE
jgi:hypothetical protein